MLTVRPPCPGRKLQNGLSVKGASLAVAVVIDGEWHNTPSLCSRESLIVYTALTHPTQRVCVGTMAMIGMVGLVL